MTPECCKNCKHLNESGSCHINFRSCAAWRRWFRGAWQDIRKAAEKMEPEKGGPKA